MTTETTLCKHHWLIPPTGAEVTGVCRLCGMTSRPMKNYAEDDFRGPKTVVLRGTAKTHTPEKAAASAEGRGERVTEGLLKHYAAVPKQVYVCAGCGGPVPASGGYKYCETCRADGFPWTCPKCGRVEAILPRQLRRKLCYVCSQQTSGKAARKRAMEAREA